MIATWTVRGGRRVRRALVVAVSLTVLVAQAAAAAWLIGSLSASAAARTVTLPVVTGVTATAGADGSATVTWQPVSLPADAGPATYQVLAYPEGGGTARTPGGSCAGTGGLVPGTTCQDSSVPDGTWVYRVAVHLASWTGAASEPSAALTFPTSPCAGATTNPVVAENCRPGSPRSEWDVDGSGDASIQGFTTDISTDQGGTVRFKVDTSGSAFRIDVYRLGWYGGDGARKVATVPAADTTATQQPGCLRNATGIADCGNWSVSATWHVPTTAVSGVYIGRLVRTDTSAAEASHVPFVVRDDDGGANLLFQTSDTTWQAYNRYGGASLYQGDGPGTGGNAVGRAYKVSYNRPITTRAYAPEDALFNSEYPMIRWLERNGYDVSYLAGVDTHRSGASLLGHRAFLSVGHDEYWSGPQRANVEAARAAGVNLAFFSGNEIFWRTRFEDSIDGTSTADRTLVAYKETHDYPNNPDPTSQWTGTWRDPRDPDSVNLPENALSGTLPTVTDGSASMTVPAEDGGLRLWRGSSVASSPGDDTFGDSVIGYEWDEDLDNGARPAGQIRLSDTTVTGVGRVVPSSYGSEFATGTARHTLTMHRDPRSGALVFGAGTAQWSWGLDADHDRGSGAPVTAMQQATVNVLADMGSQPTSLQSDLVPADASTDTSAPTSTVTGPSDGGTVGAGATVTVTGTAADTGGGRVGGVEVSTDDGATWHPAEGRNTWTYTFTAPLTEGATLTLRSRATDDSLNTGPGSAAVTVTVGPRECTAGAPCSVFPDAAPTTVTSGNDNGQSLEVGMKLRSSVTGQVTAVRFYKPTTGTTSYTGRVYSGAGAVLGSSAPTSVSGSGWQVLPLISPVSVVPGTTYVASYYSESGDYAYTAGGGAGGLQDAVLNPPLRSLAAGVDGPNGVYTYGAGFPQNAPQPAGSNYWADVLFVSGADTTAPTVSSTAPAGGATDVPVSTAVTATFDEPVDANTVTGTSYTLVPTAGGPVVPATVSASGATVTLQPGAPLATDTDYTATLSGGPAGITDTSGNPLAADHSWSFRTAASNQATLFGDATPNLSSDDADYELGVRFASATDGVVTGIRFYKGAQNTGLHTGRLWNATTQELLGTVTFVSETATGWQTAYFDAPVPVQAGTTYIASYTVPSGHYAQEADYFTGSGHTSGPLTAPQATPEAPNGVFSETPGQFPTATFRDSNYFVDVTFQEGADTTAPTVTERSPVAGATGVPTGTGVTATFSEAVKAATVTGSTFTLAHGTTAVPATVSRTGGTVTLNPSSPLDPGTDYTATLRGGAAGITDLAGNPLAADVTWTFTTASAPSTFTVFGTDPGGAAQGPDTVEPIEAGVKLRVAQGGYVSAVRFYKPFTQGDSFTGRLYTASGTLLGQGTTSLAANATGWQEIPLASPVALSPGTTYVATYLSPTGRYAATPGGLVDAAVTNGPVTALRSGTDGPNGVFQYGGGFPTSSSATPANYWADVVFQTGPLPPDTTAPTVVSRTPAPGSTGASPTTAVTAGFDESVDPASVTASTVTLTGPAGAVPATPQADGATVTLSPTTALQSGTTYTATVSGGSGGVRDLAGNALAQDVSWSFTTRVEAAPRPDPEAGPGGPVLVVPGGGGYGEYIAEMLRGEGLNLFTVGNAGDLTASGLAPYTTLVLGATSLSTAQVDALTAWVDQGGDLVALRPDPQLNGLLGLTGPSGTLAEGYLQVDTGSAPGKGITGQTMQFHGTADRYGTAPGTQIVATLFSTATSATTDPAVTVRQVGDAGGSASAFTYDLARSVVLTRQGNPDWVNQNRDGEAGPNRPDDLFFGAMAGDPQPDYVDRSKIAIPQADEQQRLLANVLTQASLDAQPLPRFWYLPRGEKAAIVMTADEHGDGSVSGRFDQEIADSPAGCSVPDWQCVRSTAYIYATYPSMTAAQASSYEAQGFEVALHPNTQCQALSRQGFADSLTAQLADLAAKYPALAPSATSRNHCMPWIDYTTVPEEQTKQGIHLDTDYYYWPATWVNDAPGMFTGSGFPQRFATTGGRLVDVYQAPTQMTDESGQSFPATEAALLDKALGPEGFYGTFVANIHTDSNHEALAAQVVAAAQARGVPVISARQLLTWTDGRNASSFGGLGWDPASGELTFHVDVGTGARGLQAMIPLAAGGDLQSLTGPGGPVTPTTRTVKGVDYAVFPALAGTWTATYDVPAPAAAAQTPSTAPAPDAPRVSDSTQADFGAGTGDGTSVRPDGDGAVGLGTTTDRLDFDAPAFPDGWAARATPWSGGGTAAVDGGALTVDGTAVFGPSGRHAAVEARAAFDAQAGQDIGFAADTDLGGPWFTFGTGQDADQVYARSSTGVDVGLGAGLLGGRHTYRVEWAPGEVRWYVDGELRHTAPISASGPLLPVVSDADPGTPGLVVDSLETSRYADAGTFTSRVLDAGQTSTWGALTRDADAPVGTSLAVEVRTGETAAPDTTWSPFAAVAPGEVPSSPLGRYLQYRLSLASTDPRVTPLVRSVTIGGP